MVRAKIVVVCLVLAGCVLPVLAADSTPEAMKAQIEKEKQDLLFYLDKAGKSELTKPIKDDAFKIIADWQETLKQTPALKDLWRRAMGREEQVKELRTKRAAIEASHAAELADLKKQDDVARKAVDDVEKDPRLEGLMQQIIETDNKLQRLRRPRSDTPEARKEQQELKTRLVELNRQYQEMGETVRRSDKMHEAGQRQHATTQAYQKAVAALPGVQEIDKTIHALNQEEHDAPTEAGPEMEAYELIKGFGKRLEKLSSDAKAAGVQDYIGVRSSVETVMELLMKLALAAEAPKAP